MKMANNGQTSWRLHQYATRFCVVRVPEPVLLRLAANEAPLLIKFTDKRHISRATGDDVTRRGESILKSG